MEKYLRNKNYVCERVAGALLNTQAVTACRYVLNLRLKIVIDRQALSYTVKILKDIYSLQANLINEA